jgi:hypothetical protein
MEEYVIMLSTCRVEQPPTLVYPCENHRVYYKDGTLIVYEGDIVVAEFRNALGYFKRMQPVA